MPDFGAAFLPTGAPRAGEAFRCPEQAATLRHVAETGGEAFYLRRRGSADRCTRPRDRRPAERGRSGCAPGHVGRDDLEGLPRCRSARDPTERQGLAALVMLGILEHHPIADHSVDAVDSLHLQVEAAKLALADAHRYVSDPDVVDVPTSALLDLAYAPR